MSANRNTHRVWVSIIAIAVVCSFTVEAIYPAEILTKDNLAVPAGNRRTSHEMSLEMSLRLEKKQVTPASAKAEGVIRGYLRNVLGALGREGISCEELGNMRIRPILNGLWLDIRTTYGKNEDGKIYFHCGLSDGIKEFEYEALVSGYALKSLRLISEKPLSAQNRPPAESPLFNTEIRYPRQYRHAIISKRADRGSTTFTFGQLHVIDIGAYFRKLSGDLPGLSAINMDYLPEERILIISPVIREGEKERASGYYSCRFGENGLPLRMDPEISGKKKYMHMNRLIEICGAPSPESPLANHGSADLNGSDGATTTKIVNKNTRSLVFGPFVIEQIGSACQKLAERMPNLAAVKIDYMRQERCLVISPIVKIMGKEAAIAYYSVPLTEEGLLAGVSPANGKWKKTKSKVINMNELIRRCGEPVEISAAGHPRRDSQYFKLGTYVEDNGSGVIYKQLTANIHSALSYWNIPLGQVRVLGYYPSSGIRRIEIRNSDSMLGLLYLDEKGWPYWLGDRTKLASFDLLRYLHDVGDENISPAALNYRRDYPDYASVEKEVLVLAAKEGGRDKITYPYLKAHSLLTLYRACLDYDFPLAKKSKSSRAPADVQEKPVKKPAAAVRAELTPRRSDREVKHAKEVTRRADPRTLAVREKSEEYRKRTERALDVVTEITGIERREITPRLLIENGYDATLIACWINKIPLKVDSTDIDRNAPYNTAAETAETLYKLAAGEGGDFKKITAFYFKLKDIDRLFEACRRFGLSLAPSFPDAPSARAAVMALSKKEGGINITPEYLKKNGCRFLYHKCLEYKIKLARDHSVFDPQTRRTRRADPRTLAVQAKSERYQNRTERTLGAVTEITGIERREITPRLLIENGYDATLIACWINKIPLKVDSTDIDRNAPYNTAAETAETLYKLAAGEGGDFKKITAFYFKLKDIDRLFEACRRFGLSLAPSFPDAPSARAAVMALSKKEGGINITPEYLKKNGYEFLYRKCWKLGVKLDRHPRDRGVLDPLLHRLEIFPPAVPSEKEMRPVWEKMLKAAGEKERYEARNEFTVKMLPFIRKVMEDKVRRISDIDLTATKNADQFDEVLHSSSIILLERAEEWPGFEGTFVPFFEKLIEEIARGETDRLRKEDNERRKVKSTSEKIGRGDESKHREDKYVSAVGFDPVPQWMYDDLSETDYILWAEKLKLYEELKRWCEETDFFSVIGKSTSAKWAVYCIGSLGTLGRAKRYDSNLNFLIVSDAANDELCGIQHKIADMLEGVIGYDFRPVPTVGVGKGRREYDEIMDSIGSPSHRSSPLKRLVKILQSHDIGSPVKGIAIVEAISARDVFDFGNTANQAGYRDELADFDEIFGIKHNMSYLLRTILQIGSDYVSMDEGSNSVLLAESQSGASLGLVSDLLVKMPFEAYDKPLEEACAELKSRLSKKSKTETDRPEEPRAGPPRQETTSREREETPAADSAPIYTAVSRVSREFDIASESELAKSLVGALVSYDPGMKVVLAFHEKLQSYDKKNGVINMIRQMQRLKRKSGFAGCLENLEIVESFTSGAALYRELRTRNIDFRDGEKAKVFVIAPASEAKELDNLPHKEAFAPVFIDEGNKFNVFQHYYPLPEALAIALITECYKCGISSLNLDEDALKSLNIDRIDAGVGDGRIYIKMPANQAMLKNNPGRLDAVISALDRCVFDDRMEDDKTVLGTQKELSVNTVSMAMEYARFIEKHETAKRLKNGFSCLSVENRQRLLDCGAGDLKLTEMVSERFREVTAVERINGKANGGDNTVIPGAVIVNGDYRDYLAKRNGNGNWDAILFSHSITEGGEEANKTVRSALSRMSQGGLMAIVCNNGEKRPGTINEIKETLNGGNRAPAIVKACRNIPGCSYLVQPNRITYKVSSAAEMEGILLAYFRNGSAPDKLDLKKEAEKLKTPSGDYLVHDDQIIVWVSRDSHLLRDLKRNIEGNKSPPAESANGSEALNLILNAAERPYQHSISEDAGPERLGREFAESKA